MRKALTTAMKNTRALVRSSSKAEYLETCESFSSSLSGSGQEIRLIDYQLPDTRGDRTETAQFWSVVRSENPDLIVSREKVAAFKSWLDR